jgi:hypothetical protein
MESARSIERQRRLISNTIAQIKKRREDRMPDASSMAEDGPLDTFYAKDGGPLSIWPAMGTRRARAGDEGWTLFPGREP